MRGSLATLLDRAGRSPIAISSLERVGGLASQASSTSGQLELARVNHDGAPVPVPVPWVSR
jgi:hypothetical protein